MYKLDNQNQEKLFDFTEQSSPWKAKTQFVLERIVEITSSADTRNFSKVHRPILNNQKNKQ